MIQKRRQRPPRLPNLATPPTKEEVAKVLRSTADPKTKAAMALMAFSGLRIDVISELMIKDCPDLAIGSHSVRFTHMPAKVIWSRKIWRNGKTFCTFLCEPGCTFLRDYLTDRMRTQKLTPVSKIIENNGGLGISRQIKKAIVRGGFAWKPYSLRHYFAVGLMRACMDLNIPDFYTRFFMGHIDQHEMELTPDARNLPSSVETALRQSYQIAADKYLVTT